MLKKLQHKFVGIAIIALITIVFVELLSVNVVNIYQHDSDARSVLYMIAENDGSLPDGTFGGSYYDALWRPFLRTRVSVEPSYSSRYFVVKLHGNVVTGISTTNISSVSNLDAFEYASKIFGEDPGYGFIDSYRYYYRRDDSTDDAIMVFLDYGKDLESTFTLATISLLVGIAFVIILAFPVYLLSKNALAPVKRSIEQQKQFITDAGHELKTPLAIISADADVLEMCDGNNEWVQSIKAQTKRMDALVKDMVRLSKLDEASEQTVHVEFDLSKAVLDTAMNFEPIAKSKGLTLTLDVKSGIRMKGNEDELRQLVSILCDNAVKYSTENGTIRLRLFKSGKSIHLEAYNNCDAIDEEKLPHLFDRFYRADTSRARETGGYGIGLSIAKAIVERHKGKITVTAPDETSILFKIIL